MYIQLSPEFVRQAFGAELRAKEAVFVHTPITSRLTLQARTMAASVKST